MTGDDAADRCSRHPDEVLLPVVGCQRCAALDPFRRAAAIVARRREKSAGEASGEER